MAGIGRCASVRTINSTGCRINRLAERLDAAGKVQNQADAEPEIKTILHSLTHSINQSITLAHLLMSLCLHWFEFSMHLQRSARLKDARWSVVFRVVDEARNLVGLHQLGGEWHHDGRNHAGIDGRRIEPLSGNERVYYRINGMRSWIGRRSLFACVVMIVKLYLAVGTAPNVP
jgi:hypothetical protein